MKSIEITRGVEISTDTNEILFSKRGQVKRVKIEPIMTSIMIEINVSDGFVSRTTLVERVWDGNPGVGEKSLTRNIYKLRKVFTENGFPNFIETIPKKGYRLRPVAHSSFIRRLRSNYAILTLILLILSFVILKINNPGFGHYIFHRLFH